MKRRTFIRSAATASLATPFAIDYLDNASAKSTTDNASPRGPFAIDDNRVRLYSSAVSAPLKVMVVADTHLFTDDERGKPYQQFSGRMAAAYNETRHFQTGEPTNPEESFARAIERAEEKQVDLLALVGDIVSFPSEAAIEWVGAQLAKTTVPYLYVAGNHDWHYEGMPGPLEALRATWTEKRLKPLYQGENPLMSSREIGGMRFLAIDNSNYEILPEQLEFFRTQARTGQPLVLLVHIPLYAPGRPVGFGCGHPDWGAKSDRNPNTERRPRWPEAGHTPTTLTFHREVFATPNLLGIFAGHIHRPSLDVVNGIPQFVTDANATGAFMDAEVLAGMRAGPPVARIRWLYWVRTWGQKNLPSYHSVILFHSVSTYEISTYAKTS